MKGKKKEKPFLWSENFSFLTYCMHNYNENIIYSQARELNLRATGLHTVLKIMGDISHLFGNEVPYPQAHYYSNEYSRMVYCWYIDGFFKTQKNVQFINDIIARFKLTADCQLHSFKSVPMENINPIKLKAFMGLKSLAKDKLKEKYQRVETRADDYVFWCLKLYAEDMIRENGLIIWDSFEKWAFDNFIDISKDKSTLRAKCRNIFNWYFDNNWKIGRVKKSNKTKEQIMATREQHARNMTKKREEKARKKVLNVITGMFAHEYKKPDGSWNVSKIAKDSDTNRRTVMKYLPKEALF